MYAANRAGLMGNQYLQKPYKFLDHPLRFHHYLKLLLLALLIGFPTTSWPQNESNSKQGWYAGGGIGIANVYSWTDTCYGCWADWDYGDSDFAYTFTGGYRFIPYFAIEASYLDSGTPEWNQDLVYIGDLNDTFNVDAKIDLNSYQVSVLSILPFFKIWEVYLRLGMAFWDGDSNQVLTRVDDNEVITRNVNESGTDFLLGGGIGVTLRKRWNIRLDYVYFAIDDELLALGGGDNAYSDIATLQLHYRIGDGW
jgi:hypothetical protein